jgi:hypothetical protein
VETFIRRMTVAAVLAVAGFAAVVSWQHIFDLARTHGQSELAAALIPLSVDGDVLASGLVLLWFARRSAPSPALGRVMLFSGVGMTIWANLVYGLPYGFFGAMLSGWPGYAFVGTAELVLMMVRAARHAADITAGPSDGPMPAIHRVFADQIAARQVPSIRAIKTALSCGQSRAEQVKEYLTLLAQALGLFFDVRVSFTC